LTRPFPVGRPWRGCCHSLTVGVPVGGALALFLSQGLSELPVYFGYVMPRLAARWHNRWLAWLVVSLMLAAQHCTLPLVLDLRFIAWRFLMFLPLTAVLLHKL
jgi:membrane protease YdiL (CAAX protease family)